MLQCGGGDNTTSALLKQYFASERACQLSQSGNSSRGGRSLNLSSSNSGILPCITAHTDITSMKKASSSYRSSSLSPRNAPAKSPRGTMSLPKTVKGASSKERDVPQPPAMIVKPLDHSNNSGPTSLESTLSKSPRSLSHGKTGPFGRRNIEKEFFDTVSSGHIPCLSMQ